MSPVETFRAGGPLMWLLVVCALVSLAVVTERALGLRRALPLDPSVVQHATRLLEEGRTDRAIECCREHPGTFTNILAAGLEAALCGEGEEASADAVRAAGRLETAGLCRNLGILRTIVGIAPLIGLLGTIFAMIGVFQAYARSGGSSPMPEVLSGLSRALVTAGAGVLIAVPSVVAHNLLRGRAASGVAEFERESLRLLRSVREASTCRPRG